MGSQCCKNTYMYSPALQESTNIDELNSMEGRKVKLFYTPKEEVTLKYTLSDQDASLLKEKRIVISPRLCIVYLKENEEHDFIISETSSTNFQSMFFVSYCFNYKNDCQDWLFYFVSPCLTVRSNFFAQIPKICTNIFIFFENI